MKTSWIIGIVSLWVVCYILCSVIENTNLFTSEQTGMIQSMLQPEGTEITSIENASSIGQAYSLITNVWSYLISVIKVIFLWFPDLWSGNWIWFYYCFIAPLSIGLIVSIVFILRGVQSG